MNRVLWGVGALSVVALWGCPGAPSMTCDAGVWHTQLRMCVGTCNELTIPRCGETGVDASACAANETMCGGRCVNTQSDPANCGRCANSCAASDGGPASCNAGACEVQCPSGSHACGGSCVASDSPTTCGARCEPCPAGAGERATCVMNSCATECLAGFERVGAACEVIAPRPIWPPGTSTVTSLRPTLRWESAMGVDGARVEVCRDRACTMVVATIDATGTSAQPAMDLPRSTVLFWRIKGRVGATTGTRTSPTWQFRTRANGAMVDTAHGVELDVNGDGFTDAAIGARNGNYTLHQGSATGLARSASATITGVRINPLPIAQHPVAPAGDTNGDGYGDLLVGFPAESMGATMFAGCARLYLGSASGVQTTAAQTVCGMANSDVLGVAVAGVGDIDHDGYADVAIAASQADVRGMVDAGAVGVHRGSRMGFEPSPRWTLSGPTSGGFFGAAVAPSIDVNGDGFSDVIVGATGFNGGAGNALVFLGSGAGLPSTASVTLTGPSTPDSFGASIVAGDFNGDGRGDIVVGVPMGTSPSVGVDAGNVSLFLGQATGLASTATNSLPAIQNLSSFGFSLASPGDTNRDGFDDLVVGAPQNRPGGLSNAGSAFIFRGSASGLPAMASQTIDGAVMSASFGISVGGSGDFNGDGFADAIIGAFNASPGGRSQAGTAAIYSGSATQLTLATTLEGASAMDGFGAVVALRTPARARSVYHPLACLAAR
ncbi:MAG: FG-GAP-like repeat-containing protein [Polyangiales bacterium]